MKLKQLLLTLCPIALFMIFSQNVISQETTITGTIRDGSTNDPLVGASIVIKGSSFGTVSDFNGEYSLLVRDPQAVLVFSYTGYITEEKPVAGKTVVDVSLNTDVTTLDDIVIVGYGVQQKSQVTGAISSIRNDDFKDQPLSNLASSVQGRVSGLNVITPSGTPGAGLIVSVRGSSNPLYVVDGVPMLSESNSALSTSFDTERNVVGKGQNLSSISDINPNDIESIEILKDASAAAIYGARAANGVILITTKRGKEGRTNVNFNYYTGLQNVARNIDFMTSEQMVELIEEARRNDLALYNADNLYFGDEFDPSILTDPLENFNLDAKFFNCFGNNLGAHGCNRDWSPTH